MASHFWKKQRIKWHWFLKLPHLNTNHGHCQKPCIGYHPYKSHNWINDQDIRQVVLSTHLPYLPSSLPRTPELCKNPPFNRGGRFTFIEDPGARLPGRRIREACWIRSAPVQSPWAGVFLRTNPAKYGSGRIGHIKTRSICRIKDPSRHATRKSYKSIFVSLPPQMGFMWK